MNLSDVAAERAVLSGLCAYGSQAYYDVIDLIGPHTFSLDSNQIIWSCLDYILRDNSDAKIDYPSIIAAAAAIGVSHVLDKPEEKQHLRAVMNFPVEQENVRWLAGRIKKLEVARELEAKLTDIKAKVGEVTGDESIDDILRIAEQPISDFAASLSGAGEQTRLMGDGAEEYITHLMDNPRQIVGISTGLKRYDRAIGGGLRPGGFDLIAAKYKSGKTSIADHVATYVAENGIPVFNVDTEMSWEEHLHRIAAKLSGFPINDIELGAHGNDALSRELLITAMRRLKSMPYTYRSVIGENFEETMSHIRRWLLKTVGLNENGKANPCVVIYDYLKLMSAEDMKGNVTEWQKLGFIATTLKNFAGRYGVPVLAFGQLNREGDIAASDRLKWFCTSYSVYRWKDEKEFAEQPKGHRYTHELSTELSRYGPGMRYGEYINIKADYSIARIEEGPTKSEVEHEETTRLPQGIVVDDTISDASDFTLSS